MAIESYEVMSSEPCDNGLCGHCDMVPYSSSPNGPIMCEGRGCYNAYIKYADDKMEEEGVDVLCDICAHKGLETMSDVGACNCCDGYEFYEPREQEVEITNGADVH